MHRLNTGQVPVSVKFGCVDTNTSFRECTYECGAVTVATGITNPLQGKKNRMGCRVHVHTPKKRSVVSVAADLTMSEISFFRVPQIFKRVLPGDVLVLVSLGPRREFISRNRDGSYNRGGGSSGSQTDYNESSEVHCDW